MTGQESAAAATDPVDATRPRSILTPVPASAPRPVDDRQLFDTDDFFGHQQASSAELPDPTPLLENLTRCVIEVLAGARELEQISRWVSDDVYRHLLKRNVKSGIRQRSASGTVSGGSPHLSGLQPAA